MNSDLIRLLDEAVPEPPRLLNARSVVIAATRRHRIRVSGLVIAVAAIGVIAVTASPAALGRNGQAATMRVTQVPLTISALDHQTSLSASAIKLLSEVTLVHPGRGSLVATKGAEAIYVTEATGGQLCTVVDEGDGASFGGCGLRANLLTTGLISSSVPSHPTADFAGAHVVVTVPDGYRTATIGTTTVQVTNNVAALDGPFSVKTLVIAGPKVPSVIFDLATYLHT